MPAGQVYVQGEVPARSRTAFFGTAWGNVMYAARRATISALNWSGTATVQAVSHSWQPVHAASSTNLGLRRMVALKRPFVSREMPSTSVYVRAVTLGWWIEAAILGVEMQLAQSSVGKTLDSKIIRPPTLASFSTSRTLYPMSPSLSADSMPAMPL